MAKIKVNERNKQVVIDTFGVDIEDDQVSVSVECSVTDDTLVLGTLEVPYVISAEDILNPETGEALKHYRDYTYSIDFNGTELIVKSTQPLNKYNLTTSVIKKIVSKLAPGASRSAKAGLSEAELEEIAAERELLKSLRKKV